MEATVEEFIHSLTRSRLLSSGEVEHLQQLWSSTAGERVGDPADLARWLVARQYLTDYQAGLLLRGHADRFFLNQYKILDRVGKGRMAGVYKAVHGRDQVVAIKVLPPSKAKDPETFGRFQREARLAVRFKHPNVVRTFQAGEAEGLHYLVMEYLEGETLEEVLQRRGRLPAAEAIRLIHQVMMGLQHLHEEGVVHRDLKPGNLMLVPPAPADGPDTTLQATVKIMDVGLGRALFDEGASPVEEHLIVTNAANLLGTLDYMAPEQAKDAHVADIRSDLFSVGCILYHALAGQPPFHEKSPARQMIRLVKEPPRPLSALGIEMPAGLDEVVQRLLAKDPAERFPTPERAAKALETLQLARSAPTILPATKAAPIPEKPAGPMGTMVELAATPAPQRAERASAPTNRPDGKTVPEIRVTPAEPWWQLTRRDYLLLLIGAGLAFVAEGLGWLFARLLRG
jgi:serine/threonine protein kinase